MDGNIVFRVLYKSCFDAGKTAQFGQHDNVMHVQHNDGTEAYSNMSLASS